MVQGVLLCGTFLTKRALIVIASLLLLVLILGCVSLGIGLAMDCGHYNTGGYYYYDSCSNTKLSLLINGGVLMGFTAIGLIWVAVMACSMKDAPANVAPTVIAQPYAMYSHTTAVYPGQAVYPVASPGQPQQPPVAAFTSAGVNQGHFQQYPMNGPQKHDPEAAPSSTQQPTSQHHM